MMQIKKFEAKDMNTALKAIKEEFGSEAVILSAKSFNKDKGIFGPFKKKYVEVTAATDKFIEHINYKKQSKKINKNKNISKSSDREEKHVESTNRKVQIFDKKEPFSLDRKRLYNSHYNAQSIYQKIIEQGVDKQIALEIMGNQNIINTDASSSIIGNINQFLNEKFKASGIGFNTIKYQDSKQKKIVFMGPTGVGKTTTIAKIAAMQSIRYEKKVALISLDDIRIAPIEQLNIYSKIMGIRIAVASNMQELNLAINSFKEMDLILIDTAGMSQRDSLRMNNLRKLVKKIMNYHICLVLSANVKEENLLDTINNYKDYPVNGIIYTKLDESLTLGSLLNVLVKTKIPIEYFTNGQQVPDDIEHASLERFTELVFGQILHTMNPLANDLIRNDGNINQTHNNLVANKISDIFHSPDCKWVSKINPDNLILLNSYQAAVEKGLIPCRLCLKKWDYTDERGNQMISKVPYFKN